MIVDHSISYLVTMWLVVTIRAHGVHGIFVYFTDFVGQRRSCLSLNLCVSLITPRDWSLTDIWPYFWRCNRLKRQLTSQAFFDIRLVSSRIDGLKFFIQNQSKRASFVVRSLTVAQFPRSPRDGATYRTTLATHTRFLSTHFNRSFV